MERLLRWLSLVVLSAVVVACGKPAPQPELRIGVIASFSGTASETSGRATREAAQLIEQQANAAGGVLVGSTRYKLVLIYGDDENSSQTAVDVARRLVVQDNVSVLIGPQFSANAIPVAEFAETFPVPMITPMATNPQVTNGKHCVFRVGFNDIAQARAIARFTRNQLQTSTAAILFDQANDYSRMMAESFAQAFDAAGGTVVISSTYTTGETDFKSQLSAIKPLNPAALFLPNYSADSIAQATQARELGLMAQIIGSDGWSTTRVAPVAAFDGAFFTQQWHMELERSQSKTFIAEYQTAFKRDPLVTAASTYDAFTLLFAALATVQNTEVAPLCNAMNNLGAVEGVTGTIDFNQSGDPIRDVMIIQIKDGTTHFYRTERP